MNSSSAGPMLDALTVLPAKPTVVIEHKNGFLNLNPAEFWRYRELLYFLVWRDLKVRYKQSVLGVLWIVVQPFATMVVFTLLFNRFLGVETGSDVPYPIFTYAALLPWTYFASTISRGALSLVNERNLISKVYFPRLIMPVAAVLPGLVDFAVAFVVLVGMMLYFDIAITRNLLLLPLSLLLAVTTALGSVLWFSALNVKYRDVQYVVPFVMQIWMYITPIFYPITRIPEQWQWLYVLNPMVGVVQIFRWAVLGEPISGAVSIVSVLIGLLLLGSGVVFFRRTERIFADVI